MPTTATGEDLIIYRGLKLEVGEIAESLRYEARALLDDCSTIAVQDLRDKIETLSTVLDMLEARGLVD